MYVIYDDLEELLNKKKLETRKEQKVQLIIAIVFKNIQDPSKKYILYVKSRHIPLHYGDDVKYTISKLYNTFLENYEYEENVLRTGNNFVFDSIDLTYVKIYKIKARSGSSYIETPKWISNKKATINPKNTKDECCFAWAITAALHHEDIKKDPQRITNLTPFVRNYNWKDINFPSEQKDWRTFEKNIKDFALNIMSAHNTKKKLNILYRSQHNNSRKQQVILLMISNKNETDWHYTAVKNLSRLCRGITSSDRRSFYCLYCLHSYKTKKSLVIHERLCNNHDYCDPIMPEKGKKNKKKTNIIKNHNKYHT